MQRLSFTVTYVWLFFLSDVEHNECLLDAHIPPTSLESACDDSGKNGHAPSLCGIDRFAYQFLEFGQIRRTEMAHSRSSFQRRLLLLFYRSSAGAFCLRGMSVHALLLFLSSCLPHILGDTFDVSLGNYRSRRVRSHRLGRRSGCVFRPFHCWLSERHYPFPSCQPNVHRQQHGSICTNTVLPPNNCSYPHRERATKVARICFHTSMNMMFSDSSRLPSLPTPVD